MGEVPLYVWGGVDTRLAISRLRAKRGQLETFEALESGSQGQHLALSYTCHVCSTAVGRLWGAAALNLDLSTFRYPKLELRG